jgi:hypothetical protein
MQPVGKPTWRERRADRHAAKEHLRAVNDWEAEQAVLDRLASKARQAAEGGGGSTGMMLKAGEAELWDGSASLIEPRRAAGHYQGGYSGVSFRIAKGVRYSLGGTRGHYVPGPEVQAPVDSGRVFVTSQRVVFAGGRTTREWNFAKLIGVDSSHDDNTVLVHVSNRQKVSGLALGAAGGEFLRFLALGVAISQTGAQAVAAECEQSAEEHRRLQP